MLSFVSFDEASSHVEEAHMSRNWGLSLVNSQQEMQALGSTAEKELKTVNNDVNEFEIDFS